jgi:hypothetical protein
LQNIWEHSEADVRVFVVYPIRPSFFAWFEVVLYNSQEIYCTSIIKVSSVNVVWGKSFYSEKHEENI